MKEGIKEVIGALFGFTCMIWGALFLVIAILNVHYYGINLIRFICVIVAAFIEYCAFDTPLRRFPLLRSVIKKLRVYIKSLRVYKSA